MDINQLIGKYVYITEPQLVSDGCNAYQIPVKVESISELENVAGYVVNNRLLVSFFHVQKLLNYGKPTKV